METDDIGRENKYKNENKKIKSILLEKLENNDRGKRPTHDTILSVIC